MFDRRKYAREYARRQRERLLAEQMGRSIVCPRSNGGAPCGGPLDHATDGTGRVVTTCRWCERRKAGICRDCPLPVEGRRRSAIRCRSCKVRVRSEYARRHRERHREELNAKAVRRLRSLTPEKRATLLEYKRLYRKANPDKVRAQKKRYVAKKTAAYVEYHKKYAAGVRPQSRMVVRYAKTGQRLCLTPKCPITVTHRKKRCSRCIQRDAELARRQIEARRAA